MWSIRRKGRFFYFQIQKLKGGEKVEDKKAQKLGKGKEKEGKSSGVLLSEERFQGFPEDCSVAYVGDSGRQYLQG